MDKLSEIVFAGGFPLLAAAGVVLVLAGAALWSGRVPVTWVRFFLTGKPASIPVAVESGGEAGAREAAQDRSLYEFDVGVPYRQHPYVVIATLASIGDPVGGPDVLGPLEIIGLDRFEDSSVVVRCRVTPKPVGQQRVRHEINRRLEEAFKQRVVEIPVASCELAGTDSETWHAPPLYLIVEDTEAAKNGSGAET